jgi:hypothetical protein
MRERPRSLAWHRDNRLLLPSWWRPSELVPCHNQNPCHRHFLWPGERRGFRLPEKAALFEGSSGTHLCLENLSQVPKWYLLEKGRLCESGIWEGLNMFTTSCCNQKLTEGADGSTSDSNPMAITSFVTTSPYNVVRKTMNPLYSSFQSCEGGHRCYSRERRRVPIGIGGTARFENGFGFFWYDPEMRPDRPRSSGFLKV